MLTKRLHPTRLLPLDNTEFVELLVRALGELTPHTGKRSSQGADRSEQEDDMQHGKHDQLEVQPLCRRLLDEGAQLSVETLSTLLARLSTGSWKVEIEQLYAQIAERGPPSLHVLNCMLAAHSKTGNSVAANAFLESSFEQAFAQVKAGNSSDLQTYVHLATLHSRLGQLPEMADAFRRAEEGGCEPTVDMYAPMFRAYAGAGKMEEVQALFSDMQKRGIKADLYCYNALLAAAGASRTTTALQQLQELFMQMRMEGNIQPDVVTYTAMISLVSNQTKALDTESKEDMAANASHMAQVLQDMEQAGVQHDEASLDALMQWHARRAEVDEVKQWWRTAARSGIKLGRRSLTAVVRALSNAGRFRDAIELVDRASVVPDAVLLNLVLTCISRNLDTSARQLRLPASERGGELVLQMEARFQDMLATPGHADTTSHSIMMQAYFRLGRFDDVSRVFRLWFNKRSTTYTSPKNETIIFGIAIKALATQLGRLSRGGGGGVGSAREELKGMLAQQRAAGVQLAPGTISHAMWAIDQAGEKGTMLQIFHHYFDVEWPERARSLLRRGVLQNTQSLGPDLTPQPELQHPAQQARGALLSVVKGLSKELELVLDYVELMRNLGFSLDGDVYAAMLDSMASDAKRAPASSVHSLALAIFDDMREGHIPMDANLFNNLMECMCKRGDFARLREYSELMADWGVTPNTRTYNTLIFGEGLEYERWSKGTRTRMIGEAVENAESHFQQLTDRGLRCSS